MPRRPYFLSIPLHLAAMFFMVAACAQEGLPPGGPTDTFPPYITSITPAPDSTGINTGVSPVLRFNERMDGRSVEEALFISPVTPFRIHENWGGTEFTLKFDDGLTPDQTYVVTVASGARDIRGNRMIATHTGAFSTGQNIDIGSIAGVVTAGARAAVGAYVWAYRLSQDASVDPTRNMPDYIGQTGRDGGYEFTNISPGKYRVFAFTDNGRERRYNAHKDPLGVPASDIEINTENPVVRDLNLFLVMRQEFAPTILSVRTPNANLLRVRFDSPILIAEQTVIQIQTTDSQIQNRILGRYVDLVDSTTLNIITETQTAGREHSLTISGVRNRQNRNLASVQQIESFVGVGNSDDVAPRLTGTTPEDSTGQISLGTSFKLKFDAAVRLDSLAIVLTDSAGRFVGGTLTRTDSALVTFSPFQALAPLSWYALKVSPQGIRDLSGNNLAVPETTGDFVHFWFKTLDPERLGTITGTVFDQDRNGVGSIYISAEHTSDDTQVYTQSIPSPGRYRIESMLPGSYRISAFRDRDDDGLLTPGTPVPFVPSERITTLSDSILVRSGWESEQVDFEFHL